MEIVDQAGVLDSQARSYAEYRVFASLTGYASSVDDVRVEVRHPPRQLEKIACAIFLKCASNVCIRVRATARHPYAAIDLAAVRVERRLRRLRVTSDGLTTSER